MLHDCLMKPWAFSLSWYWDILRTLHSTFVKITLTCRILIDRDTRNVFRKPKWCCRDIRWSASRNDTLYHCHMSFSLSCRSNLINPVEKKRTLGEQQNIPRNMWHVYWCLLMLIELFLKFPSVWPRVGCVSFAKCIEMQRVSDPNQGVSTTLLTFDGSTRKKHTHASPRTHRGSLPPYTHLAHLEMQTSCPRIWIQVRSNSIQENVGSDTRRSKASSARKKH